MGNPDLQPRASSRERACLAVALGSIVAWFLLLTVFQSEPTGDEKYHLGAIRLVAQGQWSALGFLTVLPIYHAGAAAALRLFGDSLAIVRGYTAVLALVATVVFYFAARRRQPDGAGLAVCLFVWNPLLFPFTALAYTETPAILALTAALLFRARGRTMACAAALLAACLIRQTTVVWLLFFAIWHAIEVPRPAPSGAEGFWNAARVRALAKQLWPYAATLVVFAGVLTAFPRLIGSDESNRVRVNVAQFYAFGFTAVVLWAPLWLEQFRRLWTRRFQPALAYGWVCALGLAAIGLLEIAFRNPHPWNVDPNFLRDWPLMWMAESGPVRLLAAACLVVVAPLVVSFVRSQPAARLLALTWLFWVLFITPHWLVDPRYYVIPSILVNFFADYSAAQARRLVVWQLALTAALGAAIVAGNRML
jgi:hypothetical protein